MADFVHVESPIDEETHPLSEKPGSRMPAKPDLSFLESHPHVKPTVVDKTFGCIIGSALGDTVGLYTEFLPKHACESVYSARKFSLVEPITEYYPDSHRARFESCAWTDDTDQALLIMLSYLYNHASSDKLSNLPQDFAARLQIWIEQGTRALDRPPCGIGALVGGVVCHKDYLKDPVDIASKRWVKTARHVAPNGSLMRTHPIGVIGLGLPEDEVWWLASDVSRTTHVDPRCVVACCISVGIVRGILRGEIMTEEHVNAAIERAYNWVLSQPELMNPGLYTDITEWEIKRHLDRKEFERHVYAKSYEELKLDNQKEMGYVYKCLGSAILTLRLVIRAVEQSVIPSKTLFEDLMTDLVMEGGDSDTNGAAAGALIGAYLGYASLPSHWALGIAHKDWLMSKILRVVKVIGVVDGEVADEIDEAPDGGKGLMNKEQLEQRDRAMLKQILDRKKERDEKEEKEKKSQKKGFAGWFLN